MAQPPTRSEQIRLWYDPPSDTLRLVLRPDTRPSRTRHVARHVRVDLDERYRPIAIVITAASWQLPCPALESFQPPEQYLTLGEASALSGLAPVTLRGRIRLGHLPATKRGRDWLVRRDELEEFLKKPRGLDWDF